MKTASAGLIALLGSTKDLIQADLWKISLKNGTVLRYTTWDKNLTLSSGNTYLSGDVILTNGKLKQTSGLEPNETDLVCYPSLGLQNIIPSMVGNISFLQAAVSGLFDRAKVERFRLFMPTPGDVSLGTVRIFLGEVTDVTVTQNECTLKCKDATYLLNIYMPRRQYQPTCAWTFGDSNCTINAAALAVTDTVGAGSTQNTILCGLAQVSGFFNYGIVAVTSGLNAGISRSVKSFSPGIVALTGPFPQPFGTGDAFTITPGCSKNFAGPTQLFSGSVVDGNTPIVVNNNIGNAAGAFNGYSMAFTSGALIGLSEEIAQWQPNLALLDLPFFTKPTVGDTFNILDPSGNIVLSGEVTSPLTASTIVVGLSNANGFFNGGTLEFTSGGNVGQTLPIVSWANGVATLTQAFGVIPSIGDECTLTSISGNTQNTCTGYNNTINFGGTPFVPIPETSW